MRSSLIGFGFVTREALAVVVADTAPDELYRVFAFHGSRSNALTALPTASCFC